MQVVAACDCFADRRAEGKQIIDNHYGNKDCSAYRLHEEVLDRKDIDTVLIATGDRWHGVLSILAARAGKDIYSEKPFCLTITEGRKLVETTRKLGTIWQCGTQRKSIPGYRIVVEAAQAGKVGKLHTITLSYGTGAGWRANEQPKPEPEPDPDVFDWNRWLGQSPSAPYSSVRVRRWRVNWNTGAGAIADMGAHFCETAQWAMKYEDSGPVEFGGEGVFREAGSFNNTPYYFNTIARYANGVRLVMDPDDKGVRFDGDEGWIWLSDFGELKADPPSLEKELAVPRSDWKVMRPHIRNFVDCVRSRKLTVSNPEVAHRAHSVFHCTNIALRLKRVLRWNPAKERFPDDDEANSMLSRAMREPWSV
jgi:predicted dehydrogenase